MAVVYNHEQIYEQLKLRIKALCDKTFEPNLPFTIRGASNQKRTDTYIQLWIKQWNPIGTYDKVDTNTTAAKYEVMVDISVHRPPTSTSMVGTTTIALAKIVNAFKAFAGTYLDSFTDGNVSYLRSSSISMRHYPIDRSQLEERSSVSCIFEVVVVEVDPTDVGYIDTIELKVKTSKIEYNKTITYRNDPYINYALALHPIVHIDMRQALFTQQS